MVPLSYKQLIKFISSNHPVNPVTKERFSTDDRVTVNNYGPQYYLSTLPKLRPQLLEEAMKDAKIRAEAITKAVGGKVGSVQSVRSGVFQVTTPDSTMTQDTGAYDTSSIEKTVTSTVSVTFAVK